MPGPCATHTPLLLRFFAFEKLVRRVRPRRTMTAPRRMKPVPGAVRHECGGTLLVSEGEDAQCMHSLAAPRGEAAGQDGPRRGVAASRLGSEILAATPPRVLRSRALETCVHRISYHAPRKVRPRRGRHLLRIRGVRNSLRFLCDWRRGRVNYYKHILNIVLTMWCGRVGFADVGVCKSLSQNGDRICLCSSLLFLCVLAAVCCCPVVVGALAFR
jgi:hypothetical protein